MKSYHVEIRICDPDAPKDWWYINSFYVDANNMEEAITMVESDMNYNEE